MKWKKFCKNFQAERKGLDSLKGLRDHAGTFLTWG